MGSGPLFSLFIVGAALGGAAVAIILLARRRLTYLWIDDEGFRAFTYVVIVFSSLIIAVGAYHIFIMLYKYYFNPFDLETAKLHDAIFQPAIGQFIAGLVFGAYCIFWAHRARSRQAELDYREKRTFYLWAKRAEKNSARSEDAAANYVPPRHGTLLGDHGHHIGHGTIAAVLLVAGLFGPGFVALTERITSISTSFVEAQFANVQGTKEQIFDIERDAQDTQYIQYLAFFDQIRYFEDLYYFIESDVKNTRGNNDGDVIYRKDDSSEDLTVQIFEKVIKDVTNIGTCFVQARARGIPDNHLTVEAVELVTELDTLDRQKFPKNLNSAESYLKSITDNLVGISTASSRIAERLKTISYCPGRNYGEQPLTYLNGESDKRRQYLLINTAIYYIERLRAMVYFLTGHFDKARDTSAGLANIYSNNPQLELLLGEVFYYADADYARTIMHLKRHERLLRDRIDILQKCDDIAKKRSDEYKFSFEPGKKLHACVPQTRRDRSIIKELYVRALLDAINFVAFRIAQGLAEGDPDALTAAPYAEARADALWSALISREIAGQRINPDEVEELAHEDTIAYARLMTAARKPIPDRARMEQALRMLRAVENEFSEVFEKFTRENEEDLIRRHFYNKFRLGVRNRIRQAELLLQ